MKKILCFLTAAVLAAAPGYAQTFYSQGFEADNSGWNVFSGAHATRVASGTNGVASKTGSFHAEAGTAVTHWGGYSFTPGCTGSSCSGTFPADGYTTAVDIYLDMAATTTNDKRFDFSSAINVPAGAHRRDFVFNAGFYNDTDVTGSGPRFVISASNNATRSSSYPKNPGRSPFTITTTGWYTFKHKFYNNGGGVLAVDLSIINASGTTINTWTLSDPTDIIGSTVGGNRYGWFVANEFSFLAIDNSTLIKIQACLNDVYVDAATGNDANDGDTPGSAKKTVQAGVNRACAGGTVHVAAGTYVEQVEIDKAVTVRGAGATTIVQSPNALTKYFTTSANNYPIIWVHDANDVVIEDLVVDGAGKGNSNYRFVGIGYDNAGGTIEDVEIKDIRNTPIDGSQHGVGILANSTEGTARTVIVNRCDIHGYQKNGTTFNGADLAATITNNTITGAGAVNFIAQNGIQVSFGATGEVNNNTVSGHSYTPATYVSAGMLLYFSNANTDDNDLLENQAGIYHINGSGTHKNNEVSATAAGTGSPFFWGIIADPGEIKRAIPSPFDEGEGTTAGLKKTGANNAIAASYTYLLDQNTLTSDGSSGGVGIGAYVFGTDVLNFTATTNTVTKWEYGFELYKDPGATLNANIIDCNQIYDNTAYGVINYTGVVANAAGNWWGDPSGPTHASNPGGTGEVISDDLTFAPWGTNANCGGSASHNFVFLATTNVTIERTKQTPPGGYIHANGKVTFKRGDPSEYDVNVTAVGNVKIIGSENKIDGDVTAGGVVSIDHGSSVTGTVTSGAAVAPIPIAVPSFGAGGASFNIPKSGTRALAPGSYNTVTLNKSATLKLTSGNYYFNQLLNPGADAVIQCDVSSGAVNIHVVTKMGFAKDMEIRVTPGDEASSHLVNFVTLQTAKFIIDKESYVLGNIIAPYAVVELRNNTQFRGSICAKEIVVLRDCLWYGHNSPGDLPGPGLLPKFAPDDDEEDGDEIAAEIATSYALAQNYPNPFNPSTMINFTLPEAGKVTLRIYTETGQLVRTLVDREMPAGQKVVRWNGDDQRGKTVAAGIYLYRLIVTGQSGAAVFTETKRMTFMK